MSVAIDQRKWNWLDTFLFFTRTLWIYYNASWVLGITINYGNKWMLFLWFIAIYLIPLLFYRPGYMNLVHFFKAESVLTGSMFFFMMKQYHMTDVYDFLLLPLIMIGYVCQVRPLLWVGISTSLLIFLTGTWLGDLFTEQFINIAINTSLFYMMGFFLGRVTFVNNKMKKLIETIQDKNKALEQYSKRIEELTIMEERNRVSQDLHDTIGHIFTSVITSLDALPFVMKANQAEAENSIKEISSLARRGLDDVRKTIHQLAPIEEHQSLSQSFDQIINEFRKHTGTKVDFYMEGPEREMGERIKFTLIRCLQEGLTNAKRHGLATYLLVILSFTEESLMLWIKDNGKGSTSIHLGFGLQTMKDRLQTLNGSFRIKSEVHEGTEIQCLIPLGKEVLSV